MGSRAGPRYNELERGILGNKMSQLLEGKSTGRSTGHKTTRTTYLKYWVWVLQKLQGYFGYFYIYSFVLEIKLLQMMRWCLRSHGAMDRNCSGGNECE